MGDDVFSRLRRWYLLKPLALRVLLTVNVVFYMLWMILLRHIDIMAFVVIKGLMLNPGLPGILLQPWQLVTYNFLHVGTDFWGFIHLFFNMAWLVWIGQEFEELYGSQRMSWLYLVTGAGGGLLTVILHALFPGVGAFGGPVHGASAAVFGVMACVVTLNPDKRIGLIFLGVIPLKYILFGFLLLDLFFGFGSGVAMAAHWGGALSGFLFARYWIQGRPRTSRSSSRYDPGQEGVLDRLESWLSKRETKPPGKPITKPRKEEKTSVINVDQNEVDRILDKIIEEGYDALTDAELRTLNKAGESENG